MRAINVVCKITEKKAVALILRQQAEMAITENGNEKNKPTYPKVIQRLLTRMAEQSENK
jgi:hypothetical protein